MWRRIKTGWQRYPADTEAIPPPANPTDDNTTWPITALLMLSHQKQCYRADYYIKPTTTLRPPNYDNAIPRTTALPRNTTAGDATRPTTLPLTLSHGQQCNRADDSIKPTTTLRYPNYDITIPPTTTLPPIPPATTLTDQWCYPTDADANTDAIRRLNRECHAIWLLHARQKDQS